MNINLHIEQLILDGIDVPFHQRHVLGTEVESELAWLLGEDGLQFGSAVGGALAFARGDDIQMITNDDPKQLGQRIAQAIYGGFRT